MSDRAAVIMIIRHGEKPTSEQETGFAVDGRADRESLTLRGWQRAGALAALFDPPTDSPLRPGLSRPDRIHATKPSHDGQHRREVETVTPLAEKLGIPVHHHHHVAHLDRVVAEVADLAGATLICWEHKVLPSIVAALGAVQPTPPTEWPGDRFDVVWVFTREGAGWSFAQVPQQLLAGDKPTEIH